MALVLEREERKGSMATPNHDEVSVTSVPKLGASERRDGYG